MTLLFVIDAALIIGNAADLKANPEPEKNDMTHINMIAF